MMYWVLVRGSWGRGFGVGKRWIMERECGGIRIRYGVWEEVGDGMEKM
jgi:hypothetical protein